MIKRMISLLLTLCILVSGTLTVYAEEEQQKPLFFTVPVHITDLAEDKSTEADFMIDPETNGLYIRADHVAQMAGGFGYAYQLTCAECAIASATLGHMIRYKYNSDTVLIYMAGSEVEYTAPFPTKFIDTIAWIPFEFTVAALNISYMIGEDELIVNGSELTPLTALSAYYTNRKSYDFDWGRDVGYSEAAEYMATGSAQCINVLNTMLDFEPASWVMTLTMGAFPEWYECEFADDMVPLFISPSQNEIEKEWGDINKDVEFTVEYIDNLLSAIGSTSEWFEASDFDATDLTKTLNKMKEAFPELSDIESFNNMLKSSTRSSAVDKLGSSLLINKNLDLSGLELIMEIIYINEFIKRLENTNAYAMEAMRHYGGSGDEYAARRFLTAANCLDAGWIGKVELYFMQNADTLATKVIPFDLLLGAPGTIALFGWSIMSSTFPFFEDGIESAENHMLAHYASAHQDDSYVVLNRSRAKTFVGSNSMNEGNLDDFIKSGYAYMKFSTIARDAAIGSLGTMDPDVSKDIIKNMTATNSKIAEFLVAMEGDDPGFVPSESKALTENAALEDFIRTKGTPLERPVPETELNPDLTPLPDNITITPEEAIELAKKSFLTSMGTLPLMESVLGDMLKEQLETYNTFAYTGLTVYVEDYGLPAYIISVNEEEMLLFVPVDGERVWIGLRWDGNSPYPNEHYRVYTELDLLDASLSDFGKIMNALRADMANALAAEEQTETSETTP